MRYVLVTAAMNEEAFIEKTLMAVDRQTVKPLRWIVVSDGSTDGTDRIVAGYTKQCEYIRLLRRERKDNRNFRSQVDAINAGCDALQGCASDFIGNLDADVSFEPDYFEVLMARMCRNRRLGLAGGWICEKDNDGRFRPRTFNRASSVAHAVQLFRRECYEQVGRYIPFKYGGPDWYACVMARRLGWEVVAFPDLQVCHHKPTLTAEGRLRGGFRQGRMDYAFGSDPCFETLRCAARAGKPYGLQYALCRFGGFLSGYLSGEPRPVSKEFVQFLRREERSKMRAALTHPLRQTWDRFGRRASR